jgi:hypothetical protein
MACLSGRKGRKEEALDWLEKAVEAGFNDRRFAEDDPDLAGTRGLKRFKEVLERIPG